MHAMRHLHSHTEPSEGTSDRRKRSSLLALGVTTREQHLVIAKQAEHNECDLVCLEGARPRPRLRPLSIEADTTDTTVSDMNSTMMDVVAVVVLAPDETSRGSWFGLMAAGWNYRQKAQSRKSTK
jgi:hypothetical protein